MKTTINRGDRATIAGVEERRPPPAPPLHTSVEEIAPEAPGAGAQYASFIGFACGASNSEGLPIASLEPGTTLAVRTRNSHYRFLVLFDPYLVLVTGGTMFPEWTLVRFEGATGGGSALKMGCILTGFQMEMCVGSKRIRTSCVRSVSIE